MSGGPSDEDRKTARAALKNIEGYVASAFAAERKKAAAREEWLMATIDAHQDRWSWLVANLPNTAMPWVTAAADAFPFPEEDQ